MTQPTDTPAKPTPRRPLGLSGKASALVAGTLALLVLGAAMLKLNHLRRSADRLSWHAAEFQVPRPGFDRNGFDLDPGRAGDSAPTARAVSSFREGMQAYLTGDDRRALAAFLKATREEPQWPAARFYLGAVRLLVGHPVAAAEDLRLAQDWGYAPPDGPCAWWLGLAELYSGDEDGGRRHLQDVVALGGEQSGEAERILQRLMTGAKPDPQQH